MSSIHPIKIRPLMEQSFLDYSMSVITDRALPDVRDGLKPVHRRILHAMHEAGNLHTKAYRKSARMVGDVIGKYHPHGDVSVYDAAVRMAQPFSMNHLLVDGQGNFGSVDGDGAAAMRYTEMRTTAIATLMFDDISKETVSFVPNYDGSESEPSVIPAPYPNLLVNGTDGIAVGMATSIPPHNLRAVAAVARLLATDPAAPVADIARLLQGPDFPTGGIVYSLAGMVDAIESGRGKVRLRAQWHEEERKRGGTMLIIDALPYQVNKARLVATIANLVREKEVEDITGLRDESSKEGLRIAVDLKAGTSAEVVFAQLAAKTDLDVSVSYNCVVLDGGIPRLMGLRQIVLSWLAFRREVVTRRYVFERKQAVARLHLLDGFIAALGRLDEVLGLIRGAASTEAARDGLMALLDVDLDQAKAILDLRLQKLTGMEIASLRAEHADVQGRVENLSDILDSPEKIQSIALDEMDAIAQKFGRERQTEVGAELSGVSHEDMIPNEEVLIAMTRGGYVKRLPANALSVQNRGTRGKRILEMDDGDEINALYHCKAHDLLLVFARSGQSYGVKAWRMPESSLSSKGRHLRNVFDGLEEDIMTMVAVPADAADCSVVTVTAQGQIKRTEMTEYGGATRRGGVQGVNLAEGDSLVGVFVCQPHDHVMMASSGGRAIRFDLEDVRPTGRATGGVRGMKLDFNETVVGAYVIASTGKPLPQIETVNDEGETVTRPDTTEMDAGRFLICVGARGVGKRTSVSEFPLQSRAGKGVICFKPNNKTGAMVAALGGGEAMDLVMFATNGVSNRVHVSDVRETGRAAAGVYLMNLDAGQQVSMVTTALRADSPDPVAAVSDAPAPAAATDASPAGVVAADLDPASAPISTPHSPLFNEGSI